MLGSIYCAEGRGLVCIFGGCYLGGFLVVVYSVFKNLSVLLFICIFICCIINDYEIVFIYFNYFINIILYLKIILILICCNYYHYHF